jgi:acetyl esterase/lipase
MGVVRSFHGHTHDDQSDAYATQREWLGFDARAVDYRCIKNGLGELINAQQFHLKGA